MNGDEKFILNSKDLDFGILDFWKYKYSNIYNMQEVIAEFIVEKALGLNKSHNTDYWTLFDILYRNYRIEVKETSYYHPWNEKGKISKQRTFSITKANSNYESDDIENKFERQNDIYVFCLNVGTTKETSNPMNLNNWIFYIVPTSIINEECGDNKTISLNRIKKISKQVTYEQIKETIDLIINMKKNYSNYKLEKGQNEFSISYIEENNKILIEEINRIKSEKWKDIFLERLKGKTVTDIGKNNNLSKERISKIINKIIGEMNNLKEDSYREIFEEYFIEKELFCKMFNEEHIVYEYLNLKYKIGYNNLNELYCSNKLNTEQNKILKDHLNNINKKIFNDNWHIAFKTFLSKKSLTAKNASELTGLSKSTIDSYMQGKRKPSDENMQLIKEKLGFDILQSIYNIK